MNAAVLHVNSARAEAITPTMRICRFVADTLGIPLIHNVETGKQYEDQEFDILFVKYGVLKFSNHREEALKIYGKAKRIINLENDYTFKPDPRFRKANSSYDIWGTVPSNSTAPGSMYFNWNVLTPTYPAPWLPAAPLPQPSNARTLFYFGAYRPGRVPAFNRFFVGAPYPVTVSAYGKNLQKFKDLDSEIVTIRSRDLAIAKEYGATIYIEDSFSQSTFCSLANRFYECLQMGVPIIIDVESENTFKEAKLKGFSKFIARNQHDVSTMLAHAPDVAKEQRKMWYRDFTTELKVRLITAMSSVELGLL